MDYAKIISIVKEAGEFVFQSNLRDKITMKGESDFLTEVDMTISNFVKEKLAACYPEAGFMSEEEDNGTLSETRFILDPVDGTTNLVFDYRMSSVSLAYCENGEITFGIVYNPFNKELFSAIRNEGAFLDGKRLKTNNHAIKDSIIEFGAGSTKKQYAETSFALARDIFMDCIDIRRICSSALAICYIAAGRLDGYFERVLKPWDYAAASLILSEAGGKSTEWSGASIQFKTPSTYLASNGIIHEYLINKVNEKKYKY